MHTHIHTHTIDKQQTRLNLPHIGEEFVEFFCALGGPHTEMGVNVTGMPQGIIKRPMAIQWQVQFGSKCNLHGVHRLAGFADSKVGGRGHIV